MEKHRQNPRKSNLCFRPLVPLKLIRPEPRSCGLAVYPPNHYLHLPLTRERRHCPSLQLRSTLARHRSDEAKRGRRPKIHRHFDEDSLTLSLIYYLTHLPPPFFIPPPHPSWEGSHPTSNRQLPKALTVSTKSPFHPTCASERPSDSLQYLLQLPTPNTRRRKIFHRRLTCSESPAHTIISTPI